MDNAIVYGVAIVPLITGVVEACKKMGLSTKWAPAIAVVLGIVMGFVVSYSQGPIDPIQSLVVGAGYGLAAGGFYSSMTAPKK